MYDRLTGQAWQAPLFVAALGASSYTYAEATRDQQMESWLRMHVRAFEHFGGIPARAVPDFVPGNKIVVMWRAALCVRGAQACDKIGLLQRYGAT